VKSDRGDCNNGGLIVPKSKKSRIGESQPIREQTLSVSDKNSPGRDHPPPSAYKADVLASESSRISQKFYIEVLVVFLLP
jgi:hypothetical protein